MKHSDAHKEKMALRRLGQRNRQPTWRNTKKVSKYTPAMEDKKHEKERSNRSLKQAS